MLHSWAKSAVSGGWQVSQSRCERMRFLQMLPIRRRAHHPEIGVSYFIFALVGHFSHFIFGHFTCYWEVGDGRRGAGFILSLVSSPFILFVTSGSTARRRCGRYRVRFPVPIASTTNPIPIELPTYPASPPPQLRQCWSTIRPFWRLDRQTLLSVFFRVCGLFNFVNKETQTVRE